MLTPRAEAFVRLPGDAEGRLRRSVVRSVGACVSVYVYDGSLRVELGDEIALLYEIDGCFHTHAGRASRAVGERSGLALDVEMLGGPVVAEARSSRRAGVEGAGLKADIGNECMCPMVDLGAAGFAVLGRMARAVGEERRATIWMPRGDVEGRVRVASAVRTPAELTRYGFQVIEAENEKPSPLGETLARLSTELRVRQPAARARSVTGRHGTVC